MDFKTGHLRSSNMVTIFMPLDIITKIEAILYSNPRWGLPPFNEFLFSSEIKQKINDCRKKYRKRD
ncbi:hypothetical protein EFS28_03950 [Lactobacillus acidophilus]|nr:hypothetical protein [Lactobacillus acidophilus]MCT3623399.1 hypothetical protein [Lactobacillus acidophilus]